MTDDISQLIAKVVEEGDNPGPAQTEMAERNYKRGYEKATEAKTRMEFHDWFHKEVVCEYVGPWLPKSGALDGAVEAVQNGKSKLTIDDVIFVINYYKNKPTNYPKNPYQDRGFDDGSNLAAMSATF